MTDSGHEMEKLIDDDVFVRMMMSTYVREFVIDGDCVSSICRDLLPMIKEMGTRGIVVSMPFCWSALAGDHASSDTEVYSVPYRFCIWGIPAQAAVNVSLSEMFLINAKDDGYECVKVSIPNFGIWCSII